VALRQAHTIAGPFPISCHHADRL